MEKKLYIAETYKINYDTDTSRMKKDYSVFSNAYITGMKHLCNFIVYEDNGIYKEFLTDLEIPTMEERIYKEPYDKIPEYPNAQKISYVHELKGNYPVFFFLNKYDETKESQFAHLDEATDEYLKYYIDFVKKTYEKDGDYKDNWKEQLESMFMDELMMYGETVEDNGYSDEYIEEYGIDKVLRKEK